MLSPKKVFRKKQSGQGFGSGPNPREGKKKGYTFGCWKEKPEVGEGHTTSPGETKTANNGFRQRTKKLAAPQKKGNDKRTGGGSACGHERKNVKPLPKKEEKKGALAAREKKWPELWFKLPADAP